MTDDRIRKVLEALTHSIDNWVGEARELQESCPRIGHLHASLAQAQVCLAQMRARSEGRD